MSPALVAPLALVVTKGEDRTYTLTHQNSATDTTVVNISGWTILFTVRVDTNTPAVFTKTGSVTNGPGGVYTIALASSDTNISPRSYVADIWRTDSGSKTIMALGTWTVTPDVNY